MTSEEEEEEDDMILGEGQQRQRERETHRDQSTTLNRVEREAGDNRAERVASSSSSFAERAGPHSLTHSVLSHQTLTHLTLPVQSSLSLCPLFHLSSSQSPNLIFHSLHFLSSTMAAPTTRPRSDSGTIPSMETAHEEFKDNTVIIGRYFLRHPLLIVLIRHAPTHSPRCLRRPCKEEGMYHLCTR